MGIDRSHLSANERLAIVETETQEMRRVVSEIRDAIVGIRAAVERLAIVEERQVTLRERHDALCVRVGANESKITTIQGHVTHNTAARGWLERLSVPLVSGGIGALIIAWQAGIVG